MSNYKDLIQKARKSDSQLNDLPESQIGKEPKSQIVGKPEDQKVNNQTNHLAKEPENQKADSKEQEVIKDPEVNLCIKVPKSLRQHWAAEAKRKGTTLKAIISQALEEILGLPE